MNVAVVAGFKSFSINTQKPPISKFFSSVAELFFSLVLLPNRANLTEDCRGVLCVIY